MWSKHTMKQNARNANILHSVLTFVN